MLEQRLSEQSAIITAHPQLRIADPQETSLKSSNKVYRLKERTVTATLLNEYVDVQLLPGDPGPALAGGPVAFYLADDGERYLLPQSDRVILVQDLGGSTGKQVEINTAGAVSTPAGSETLSLLVAEPTSQFHDSTYPLAAGRIYPGQKIQSIDGATRKYLVFLQGFGAIEKTLLVDAGADTLQLDLDTAGQVRNFQNTVVLQNLVFERTISIFDVTGTISTYDCFANYIFDDSVEPGLTAGGAWTLKTWTTGTGVPPIFWEIAAGVLTRFSATSLRLPMPGTGIADKVARMYGEDPYVQKTKYIQFFETGPGGNRKSQDGIQHFIHGYWNFAIRRAWTQYDPVAGGPHLVGSGSGNYIGIEFGSASSGNPPPPELSANLGINEEANKYIIFVKNHVSPSANLAVPGWSSSNTHLGGIATSLTAVAYTEVCATSFLRVRGDGSPYYLSFFTGAGGTIYATRAASAWKKKSGSGWITASPGDFFGAGLNQSFGAGDNWPATGSQRISGTTNLGSPGSTLTLI